MKLAVTVWEDSVSTVCDFCSRIDVFDIEKQEVKNPHPFAFDTEGWPVRVNRLKDLGVAVLLCGAISGPLERTLTTAGIEVIAALCGSVEEIVQAYLDGRLCDARFTLPGLRPSGTRRRNRRRRGGCNPIGRGVVGNRNRRGGTRNVPVGR